MHFLNKKRKEALGRGCPSSPYVWFILRNLSLLMLTIFLYFLYE